MFTSVLAFSALYAPQPIQPLLMSEFAVSQERSAMLTTFTMLPLAIAPIFYGFLLESFSARKLLGYGVFALALFQLAFYTSTSFDMLLMIRLGVGFTLPAIFTSIMTYISMFATKDSVQKVMALYISSTIIGGFLGRFLSGLISSVVSWRISFLLLGISLLVAFVILRKLPESELQLSKFNIKSVAEVLAKKQFTVFYILIFSIFFTFAAILNFIPYRLLEISSEASSFKVGVMYTGYIMGLGMSLNAMKFVKKIGSETKTVYFALVFYTLTLVLFSYKSIPVLFVGMFLFCGSMFLAHSVASGYLNKLAENNRGITNGLYVAFYYGGGTLGSIVPGFVYSHFGWNIYLLVLAVILVVATMITLLIRKI
jgi:YNFM family putative membrane transporter